MHRKGWEMIPRRTYLRTMVTSSVVAAVVGTEVSGHARVAQTAQAQDDTWRQTAKLSPGDGDRGDEFGESVALDGNIAIVGSEDEDPDTDSPGAAYVFERDEGTWTQQAKLAAADRDPDGADDQFGWSVAVDGGTALVGAHQRDMSDAAGAGAAYVFERDGDTWIRQATLAVDQKGVDLFGYSVALDGDTALISASNDDTPNGQNAGSAFVFQREGTDWSRQAKLAADDGDSDDLFGEAVALDGGTALVGASSDEDPNGEDGGSAYVFEQDGGEWTQQAKLTAADGEEGETFGISVALSGDTAISAASRDEPVGGSAYVFERDGGDWTQQTKLTADDGESGDFFGISVAIDGATTLIGAAFDDDPAQAGEGAAYVFKRDGSNWTQQAKLAASDGDENDWFGFSVALDADTALVSANKDDDPNGENAGSAYVFGGGTSGDDGETDGGDGSPTDALATYANDEGVVTSQGLLDAAADFRSGDIDASVLLDAAAAFRSGEPVT